MSEARDDLSVLEHPSPDWFRSAFDVPRKSGTVDVDGCLVHYLEWGASSAPPVLMTHGFLAHSRAFAFIAPLLAHRFHLVAFDLSGMGDSGGRPQYGDRVGEAMAVAKATGLFDHERKPIFVTHSFGGTVAIAAAEQHPQAFGGLLLCDLFMMSEARTRGFFGNPKPDAPPPAEPRRPMVYSDLTSILARYRLSPQQPCAHDYLFEYMARHSVRAVDGGYRWKFDPVILQHDRARAQWWAEIPHRFARLDQRRAIIHGRKSILFDEDSAAFVRSLTPDPLPIVGIPEAYHHLMLDQPIAFSTALEAILETWTAAPERN